jgi:hypothetical protein
MKTLEFIFKLGILFAAFAFLWFWIQLLVVVVIPNSIRLQTRYFLQLLQSLFLGSLVLKFLYMEIPYGSMDPLIFVGLLTYFLYLIRNIKSNTAMMQVKVYSNLYEKLKTKNHWEWTVALISLTITTLGIFYPDAFESQTTLWFYRQTQSLMKTPILGWIFKIFGFFFVLGTLFRFLGALIWLVSPKRAANSTEKFDDFEEL